MSGAGVADVVVIGAGVNGLCAALTLARAGRSVTILEMRDAAGGSAAAEAFHPGFRHAGTLADDTLVRPAMVAELGLQAHGLRMRDAPPVRWIASRGGGLVVGAAQTMRAELARRGSGDADAWERWRRMVDRATPLLRRLVNNPPPSVLDTDNLKTQLQALRAALSVRALGRADMFELLRALPMALRDFLDDRFEDDALKAALAGPALLGAWGGPWSPGTTALLLMREAVPRPGVLGGTAAVARALEKACLRAGVEIRLQTEVVGLEVERGQIVGVAAADDAVLPATTVVSALDPATTLLELVAPSALPVRATEQLLTWRNRGIVAVLHLALDRPISWDARPGERFGRVQIGDDLQTLERAFDTTKYTDDAPAPWLHVSVPTVEQPDLASDGGEVVTVMAMGIRHGGDSGRETDRREERRDQVYDAIMAVLGAHCEDLNEATVGYRLLLPEDIESEFGLAGGHLWHGELGLDQLLSFRPTPACAAGDTPIGGLFLAGGGIHPGGGVTLVPGVLGARRAMAAGH